MSKSTIRRTIMSMILAPLLCAGLFATMPQAVQAANDYTGQFDYYVGRASEEGLIPASVSGDLDAVMSQSDLLDFLFQFSRTKCGIDVDSILSRARAVSSTEERAKAAAINELLGGEVCKISADGDLDKKADLFTSLSLFEYLGYKQLAPLSPLFFYTGDPLEIFAINRYNFQNYVSTVVYHMDVMGNLMAEITDLSQGKQGVSIGGEDAVTRRQFAAFCYMFSTMSLPKDPSGKYPGGISGNKTIDDMIANILNKAATPGMTDEQKVKAIYDYLIYNYEHNSNSFPILFGSFEGRANPLTDTAALAEPLLFNGSGTCDTFANTFKLLAIRLGFECNYVSGQYVNADGSQSGHGWNQIKVNNEWYWVDVDVENSVFRSGSASAPSYFLYLKNDADWVKNHAWQRADWPACDGTKHPLERPALGDLKPVTPVTPPTPAPALPAISIAMPKAGEIAKTMTVEKMVIEEDGSLWAGDKYSSDDSKLAKIMDGVATIVPNEECSVNLVIKTDNTLWRWDIVWPNDSKVAPAITTRKIMDDVVAASQENFGKYTTVIKTDGSLWAWNEHYPSNSGSSTSPDEYEKAQKIMDDVVAVAAGNRHTIALKADGSVWAWGFNGEGQLGIGKKTEPKLDASGALDLESIVTEPAFVMNDVVAISAHLGGHSLAIKKDGSLWAWGDNQNGAIGDGTYTELVADGFYSWVVVEENDRPSPVKIMDNVVYAAASLWRSAAITSDGSLWMWGGDNFYGEIGDGTTDMPRYSPTKVLIDDAVAVSMTTHRTGILTRNGSLWRCGEDFRGFETPIPEKTSYSVKFPGTLKFTVLPPAVPTSSAVLINGKSVAFDAYNIDGNNYFKLRDLAYILSGTEKQFNVGWDGANNAITLTSGTAYTAVGGEMQAKGSGEKRPALTSSKIYLDGHAVQFDAYNIDGNNYFKLRDVGETFDFSITWDGTKNTIVIDTSTGYTPE